VCVRVRARDSIYLGLAAPDHQHEKCTSKRDLRYLKRDLRYPKRDLRYLKRDLRYLKRDLLYLKRDLRYLKRDLRYLKRDLRYLKRDLRYLKKETYDISNRDLQAYICTWEQQRWGLTVKNSKKLAPCYLFEIKSLHSPLLRTFSVPTSILELPVMSSIYMSHVSYTYESCLLYM
jgi:septal ring factor EnvC (AmiA/AmiB activator)